ncbi:hypothetical protein [Flavobacterium pedocola]
MKKIVTVLLLLSTVFFSCNDKEDRMADSERASKHNDSVFTVISRNWKFNTAPVNPKVQAHIHRWNEWRVFNQELHQQPKSSLNAFRIKSKNLSTRVDSLTNNIPGLFDKPAVRARISTLQTKIKSLETYMNLQFIQTNKVLQLLPEISFEVTSIQNQMSEIIIKSEIPKEEGEMIMLQALDTARHARREVQEPKP